MCEFVNLQTANPSLATSTFLIKIKLLERYHKKGKVKIGPALLHSHCKFAKDLFLINIEISSQVDRAAI
jgi:hypothetical protein